MSLTLTPLTAIIIACLAGGALSVLAAAGTLALHSRWISPLVSFAVGALLGAVFLELLPHALEHGATERVMLTVLIGLLLWRCLRLSIRRLRSSWLARGERVNRYPGR